ncbi:unnamed protein product [Mycena citricolor]|uniref:SPRY domain-containing protein n=1 Tax=Mycena citricolor TaxID=2018698 RepID=A0AAD2HS47_9AGAR|nr:unnamed protein product [Mycena citricolor]
MFTLIKSHLKSHASSSHPTFEPPPGAPPPPIYTLAAGQKHEYSSCDNAAPDDFERANQFCAAHPDIHPALIFPREYVEFGADRWALLSMESAGPASGFTEIRVGETRLERSQHALELRQSEGRCGTFSHVGDSCFTSNLPIIAGNYATHAKRGVYFEITVREMRGEGTTVALGMQCLPYPPHRLPGWHRRSVALHFDDRRLYYEDPEGGRDYVQGRPRQHCLPDVRPGDTIGCGYAFRTGSNVGHLFYTYNGMLMPIAYHGIFDQPPDREGAGSCGFDVYAAVGVSRGPVHFDVNFGGSRKWRWRGPSHDRVSQLADEWSAGVWSVAEIFKQVGDGPPVYASE